MVNRQSTYLLQIFKITVQRIFSRSADEFRWVCLKRKFLLIPGRILQLLVSNFSPFSVLDCYFSNFWSNSIDFRIRILKLAPLYVEKAQNMNYGITK